MKLFKKRVCLDIAKYTFGHRMCDQWNENQLLLYYPKAYTRSKVR